MPNQSQAAFLEALGWTLVNSWWQFGILWLIWLFLKKVLPRLTASTRYNLSLALLVGGMGWTFTTFLLRYNNLLENGYRLGAVSNEKLHGLYTVLNYWSRQALPYLAIVYLCWLAFRLVQFSRSVVLTQKIRKEGLRKAPVDWRLFLENMCGQMNIRSVQCWISDKIDTPLILGWLKPMILLPVSAVNQLSTDQLEAILIHELAHIKRNDYFWNMIVVLGEMIFYYNPFARQLIAAIREEREHSCDDWVLQFPFKAQDYAHALLLLEQQRTTRQPLLLLAARGTTRNLLLARVQRMLNLPVAPAQQQAKMVLFSGLVCILSMLALITPQPAIRALIREAISQPLASRENDAPIEPMVTPTVFPAANTEKNSAGYNLQSKQAAPVPASSLPAPGSPLPDPGTAVLAETSEPEDPAAPASMEPELTWVATTLPEQTEATRATMLALEDRTYSLVQKELEEIPEEVRMLSTYPYVPRNSFQVVAPADTTVPTATARARMSRKAKEAAVQAQVALEQLNWDKLKIQLQLNGQDAEAIQLEIEKALAQVDWNKVQEDAAKMLCEIEKRSAQQQANLRQRQAEYTIHQNARSAQQARQAQQIQQAQQLQQARQRQQAQQRSAQEDRQKKVIVKKKTVHI